MTSIVAFMALFDEFAGASWDGWRSQLARLSEQTREFYAIVGRGAGKSRIVALLACFFASRDYRRVSGERIYIAVFAPDRKQAGVTFRYIIGLLRSVPALAALIERSTMESISLATGVTIEVISASIAAPRGRAYALVIIEEAAFLPQDQSANPDVELLRAVRPALARVPGSLLAVVSSPYARRGILWQAWQRHHTQPESDVVLVRAATLDLNPTFDRRAVARAYEDDPSSAAAEYGGEFRGDLESFVDVQVLAACVVPGRRELPPVRGIHYVAFVDPSGGSADSMTLAIAHQGQRDGEAVVVIDVMREQRPPFSPEATVREFAGVLQQYGVFGVTGDRYGGAWPVEVFAKFGIGYLASERPKSDIYLNALPLFNSLRIELLDMPRLSLQLGALERRTSRGGRDSIDHPPGAHAHDDVANAVCGAALLVNLQGGYGVEHAVIDLGADPRLPAEEETQQWLALRERARRGELVEWPAPASAHMDTERDPYRNVDGDSR